MRVLHVLHRSMPALSGYSIRTSYITRFQQKLGIEPYAVTSAQHPFDDVMHEVIDGVEFLRTHPLTGKLYPGVRELRLMRALQKRVHEAIGRWKPDLIHAHSPVLVGLPALVEARRNRLPIVYEVRDLWENASVDRGKFGYDSPQYKAARGLETQVFRHADAVVVICEALRAELAPRVGKRTQLHVVGNGVDAAAFEPVAEAQHVRERLGLAGKRIVGYLGTFQPYEGLDCLVEAMPQVLEQMPNAHCVITGGTDQALERRAAELGITEHVTFTGRVPHDQVRDMYSIADVMVYPRRSTRTTELTTPLKPLEAMALAKPVIISDVQAMLELVRANETGLIFRAGDSSDLAAKIATILSDPARAKTLGKQARTWIEQQRDWAELVPKYVDIYRSLIAPKGESAATTQSRDSSARPSRTDGRRGSSK